MSSFSKILAAVPLAPTPANVANDSCTLLPSGLARGGLGGAGDGRGRGSEVKDGERVRVTYEVRALDTLVVNGRRIAFGAKPAWPLAIRSFDVDEAARTGRYLKPTPGRRFRPKVKEHGSSRIPSIGFLPRFNHGAFAIEAAVGRDDLSLDRRMQRRSSRSTWARARSSRRPSMNHWRRLPSIGSYRVAPLNATNLSMRAIAAKRPYDPRPCALAVSRGPAARRSCGRRRADIVRQRARIIEVSSDSRGERRPHL
ncbi:hypothetical protein KM043_002948 [Ampulex compressa]|nr:hypothetical protein KM043_002948 [Ampulex compressa]